MPSGRLRATTIRNPFFRQESTTTSTATQTQHTPPTLSSLSQQQRTMSASTAPLASAPIKHTEQTSSAGFPFEDTLHEEPEEDMVRIYEEHKDRCVFSSWASEERDRRDERLTFCDMFAPLPPRPTFLLSF